jgi:ribosome-associated translation inhibitor RaiA
MLIQFNTDNHVQSHQELAPEITAQLERVLTRFASQVNRVEVYLHDMNADRSGDADKRCTIEVRATGYEPLAVSHDAAVLMTAFNGARDKLVRTLDRRFGRLRHPKAHDRQEQGLNP